MNEDNIQVGDTIRHLPTAATYIVNGIGKLRLPDGKWVGAARYSPVKPRIHESKVAEYYRPLTDFGNFIKVS